MHNPFSLYAPRTMTPEDRQIWRDGPLPYEEYEAEVRQSDLAGEYTDCFNQFHGSIAKGVQASILAAIGFLPGYCDNPHAIY